MAHQELWRWLELTTFKVIGLYYLQPKIAFRGISLVKLMARLAGLFLLYYQKNLTSWHRPIL